MVSNDPINFTHPNSCASQIIEYTGLTGPVGIQCDPKTLSGIVFLTHQLQLKYVEPVSLQYVPKHCQKSCNLPHQSQL